MMHVPAEWMVKAVALKDSGLSCREIAKRLGKNCNTVTEFLKRYDKLVPEAKEAYLSGKIGTRLTLLLATLAPEQQEDVLAVLTGGEKGAFRLREEIKALRAEKRVLEREVKRLRAPSLFASKLRKLVLALEKEETEVAELASQVDLRDYFLEAQRWVGVFSRYVRYVKEALEGRKVIVLDVEANRK